VITHPEKVLFPDDGISKGELAQYYEAVAPYMLPHLAGRPVTMERFPAGIAKPGFVQKDIAKGFPAWLKRVEVPKHGGSLHHGVIDDARSLLWLANQNCITPHVWSSALPDLYKPNLCVFDLDPSHEDLALLRAVALMVRDLLLELGLPSWPKTSGSKGFHIVVPLDGQSDFEQVARFAHGVGALLVKRHPEQLTQEFIKADRQDRMLIDTGRNGYSATFAAAYAVRAKPGAPVSAPCTWDEIERGLVTPQSFHLRTMVQRLSEVGELWADLHAHGQALAAASALLEPQLSELDWNESLGARTRKPLSKDAPRKGKKRTKKPSVE
jgi:bifunctional non-homologous end joining protein LigD